jgi:hypothetical protein
MHLTSLSGLASDCFGTRTFTKNGILVVLLNFSSYFPNFPYLFACLP